MAHKLADETWATILELILDVQDDDFISFETHTGPFSHRDHSNADVLLVCKRWLRIATPLAFHTCIIRSTAQSQALAKALKKSPEFGVLVKRLRLEGCYGASVPNILEKATRLEDLAITLPISSKDNGRPMFAVLNTLQPRRLIICNSPNMYNAQIIFAVDKLKDFIRECDSLQSVVMPLHLATRMPLAPSSSSNLHLSTWIQWPHQLDYEAALELLTTVKSLRRIEFLQLPPRCYFERPSHEILARFGERIIIRTHGERSGVSVQELFTQGDERRLAAMATLTLSSGRPALSHVPPSLQSTIWTHVFRYVCEGSYGSPACRMFWDICTRHCLRSVRLLSHAQAVRNSRILERAALLNSITGSVVRNLHLGESTPTCDMKPCVASPSPELLRTVIHHCSQLTVVTCWRMSIEILLLLASVSGQSLLQLNILKVYEEESGPGSTFVHLNSLRQLQLGSSANFKTSASDWSGVAIHAPSLQELKLNEDWLTVHAVLPSLTNGRLPQLRHLTISWPGTSTHLDSHRAFIAAHGASIVECTVPLDLIASVAAHCHALETLVVWGNRAVFLNQPSLDDWREAFQTSSTFISLRHLTLHASLLIAELDEIPDLFSRDRFPVLEDIQLHSFAWTQNNSSQQGQMVYLPTGVVATVLPSVETLAVAWSQRYAEAGIRVTDDLGNKWRPRLTTTQSRGRQAKRAR